MSSNLLTTIAPGLLRVEPARPLTLPSTRGIVFLDRDGVLNGLVEDPGSGVCESPLDTHSVELLPGVPAALIRLCRLGLLPVCVTNQPAAAKGMVSVAQLIAVHERVIELLAERGAGVAASYICLHHPHGIGAELGRHCVCRKPAPGMLFHAAATLGLDTRQSWMVGDTDADICAGTAARCHTALLLFPGSFHKRKGVLQPDRKHGSLGEMVKDLSSIYGKTARESNEVMVTRHQKGHHARSDLYPDFRRRRRP